VDPYVHGPKNFIENQNYYLNCLYGVQPFLCLSLINMAIPLVPSIVALSLAVFSSLLLIIKGDNETFQMKFLGGTLFIYNLLYLTHVLWFDFGLILEYPHLLRSFSPILFLVGPLFYISIRNIVFGTNGFKKKDLYHLLPAVLHFIELIPLYTLSASEKLAIIQKIVAEQGGIYLYASGIVPSIWVDLVRLGLIIAYFAYSVYLVWRSNQFLKNQLKQHKFKTWFYLTFVFFGIIHVFFLIQYIHNVQFFFTGIYFPGFRIFFLTFLLFCISIYSFYSLLSWELSFKPLGKATHSGQQAFYPPATDVRILRKKLSTPEFFEIGESELSESEVRERLTKLLEQDQIFLIQGLLVSDFAKELGISSRYLRGVLDRFYGKSFKDLINLHRVKYAKRKIEEGYLNKFTLDSLGKDAGFSSRTTFFNVFKKEMLINPSDYWKKFQEGFPDLN
jgi:AraC-like DNA-binding protein